MEVQFGPNSLEEPSLLYKIQRKIKVFNTSNSLPNRGYSLVTSSSKYGIVFIAVPDGSLSVYYLNQLIDQEGEPQHFSVKLQETPSHVAVSCDHELLAVTGGQLLSIYKVTDFQNQNVSSSLTLKCDVNPSTFVSALQWNPCIPDSLAMAFYDGTLLACQVDMVQMKKVPSKARCICWSPKGKQLVTGNSDGTLCQYKPDLTPAKTFPPPNLFEGAPVEALAIYWISTFQFAVVYKNATDNSRPALTIVHTPKAGQPSCLNYEDICYSMASNRPWYYYLQGLAPWNLILASSSNSMEVATLGSGDGSNWLQWCQTDEARPELPLTDKKQENYPVGISIDTCAIRQLPWGENEVLPHMPLLHILSHTGLLTIFNIINLKKEAAQICTPPQHLMLPSAAMTTVVPDDAPSQPLPTPAAVVQSKPQAIQQQAISTQSAFSTLFSMPSTNSAPNLTGFQQQQTSRLFSSDQATAEKQSIQAKPAMVPQTQDVPKPVSNIQPPQPPPQTQENLAQKAEQDRIAKLKANQELKNMLVKEVNDFQMELYNFMVKTRETQARLQRDIDSINSNFDLNSLDTDQLKKDCSLEELRGAIMQLKLELVRACAVVAEARTHSEAKDLHQWTQADPLTTKRVASVKKLAYYVQTQLEQAHKALDYKWNELTSRDPQYNKPGKRMTRPILDEVYQPLVKQQEILSRQQAVLRTLRSTLKECDVAPVFKSSSLLRSTPLRNKDPLSKLTKNILNMSIEPQNNKGKTLLTAQKLDALRDVLSNHKTVKIKPVNIEMRHHLTTMRQNYEKSMTEKALPSQQPITIKTEPTFKVEHETATIPTMVKTEPKPEPMKPAISIPSFTPVATMKPVTPGFSNVARTLFADEPKQEPKPVSIAKPPQALPQQIAKTQPAFSYDAPYHLPSSVPAPVDTRNVIKDLLQNKSQANLEAKTGPNIFMGQNICSPSSFGNSTEQSAVPAPSAVFTSKPITDMNNMFSKFQPHTFVSETKQQLFSPKSSETGEPEATAEVNKPFETKPLETTPFGTKPLETKPFGTKPLETKPFETKPLDTKPFETKLLDTKPFETKPKTDKPLTNLFGLKTSTPLAANTSSVPDVLKTHTQETVSKMNITIKPIEKNSEKIKENVPQITDNIPKTVQKIENDKKEKLITPLAEQTTIKTSVLTSNNQVGSTSTSPIAISAELVKKEEKAESKGEDSKAKETPDISAKSSVSSIFSAANAASSPAKPEQVSETPTVPTPVPSEISSTASEQSSTTTTPTSASSIFGAAVSAQPKTTQSGSIFATTSPPSPSSVFGSKLTQGSIFGTAHGVGTVTTQSDSNDADSKPSIFSSSTSVAPSSVFSAATSQSASSIFAQPSVFPATTTSQSSVFGSSTAASVFAAAASTPTTQAPTTSVFGTSTTSTESVFGPAVVTTQASVFSTPATTASAFTPTTTQPPAFGSPATTTQSVFGTATATTQASIFGSTASGQTVFGAPTPASQTSIFGTSSAPAFGVSTQSSVFGTATPTTQSPIFGTATTTAQPPAYGIASPATQATVFGSGTPATQASIFGTPVQTSQASVFGSPPATTAQSGSLFGGAESSLFASASISTTTAPSQTSGGNIFGGGTSSVFGGGSTNIFGGKSTFGQSNTSAASIFGGSTSFGQKPANNFWSGSNTSGGTGFGQPATTQASSIFGGGTGGSFSTPSPAGQAFGSPQPAPAFGSPQQQSAPAFGGSPVFGSKPVFGQSASFGSPTSGGFGSFGGFNKSPSSGFGAPAAFGGGATFPAQGFGNLSTPGNMFGNAPTNFGSPTQSNATFENLATQNTLTFGNLAQQSGQPPQQQAPTFNTSPSFTGWRG